jgi:hypothetical protein
VALSLCSFPRKYLSTVQVWISIVFQLLCQKWCFMKKVINLPL